MQKWLDFGVKNEAHDGLEWANEEHFWRLLGTMVSM
jgi:hypothetical protein